MPSSKGLEPINRSVKREEKSGIIAKTSSVKSHIKEVQGIPKKHAPITMGSGDR
jgi:hypothetical protein